MDTTVTQPDTGVVSPVSGWAVLRPHEIVASGYFVLLAVLGISRRIRQLTSALALGRLRDLSACIHRNLQLTAMDANRKRVGVARSDPDRLLVARLFHFQAGAGWESVLISWDRILLYPVGFSSCP